MQQWFKRLSHTLYECKYHIVFCPKDSVSEFMDCLKGKLAPRLFQQYESLGRRCRGRHLYARGYYVSTIGLHEEEKRKYVQWQEKQEKQADIVQGKLFDSKPVLKERPLRAGVCCQSNRLG